MRKLFIELPDGLRPEDLRWVAVAVRARGGHLLPGTTPRYSVTTATPDATIASLRADLGAELFSRLTVRELGKHDGFQG